MASSPSAGNGKNVIVGTRDDDDISGHDGERRILGGNGNDVLAGNAGADEIYGGAGDDTINGGAGNDELKGDSGNDTLDGGAGSDEVEGGSGNDVAIYVMSENVGSHDEYDGGAGVDTLRLVLTRDEWMRQDVQADIARYLAFIAANTNSSGQATGHEFHFTAFGLEATKFEKLEVMVDGQMLDPRDQLADAIDDTAAATEDGSVSGNVLANDNVPDLVRSVELVAGPAQGQLAFNADGSYTYVPGAYFNSLAQGETATQSFTYRVTDADGDTDTATVTINITGTNDGPVAQADTAAGTENQALVIDVLANDSDVDHGAVLHVAAASVAAGQGGVTINADNTLAFDPGSDFDHLAQGASATVTITYTVSDEHGVQDTKAVAVTVTGTNDAPVVTSGAQTGAVQEDSTVLSVSGQVTSTDVDDGATASYSGDASGAYGSFVVNATTGAWTYTLDNATHQDLAAGETHDEVFTVTVTDDQGGTTTQDVTLRVTGTNDAPVITGGEATGAVTEDGARTATGHLVVLDPDHNATQTWTVVGGTSSADADYHFRADSFTILRNGSTLFQDDFSDGVAPPSAPAFTGTNGYTGIGANAGALTESDGHLVFDSSLAIPFEGVGTPDPIVGQNAVLRTNIDPASAGGLKSTANFSIMAVFDLALPDSPRESYGIRATDRLVGGQGTPPDQLGDDVIELMVRETRGGELQVVLREIDHVADQTTTIDALALNAPVGADQIRLRLDHSTSEVGALHASFEFLSGGVVVGSQAFSQVGRIFGTETPGDTSDDENWTRAEILARAPLHSDSVLSGNYGTLDVTQSGEWTYSLDNARASTQALAAGETVSDVFTVEVADEHGATDSQTVTVTVTGTNDGPVVLTQNTSRSFAEDSPAHALTATGLVQFDDVDLADTHTVGASLQSATVSGGGLPAGASAALASAMSATLVDASTGEGHGDFRWDFALADSATQFLAAGQTLTATYQVSVSDGAASATQTVTINITGSNDGPVVAAADVTGAVTEAGAPIGSLVDTGTLAFTDVDLADVHGIGAVTHSAGALGTLTAAVMTDTTGSGTGGVVTWNYSVDASAVEYLAAGQTKVESFTFNVLDGQGGSVPRTVSVTLTGTNDAPVISAADTAGAVTAVATATEAAPAPLVFTVQQYLGFQSNDLNTLRNYATTHTANYAVQTNVIDYTDDPAGFAGELPGSSRWPAAEAQNVNGTGGINDVFFARITADFSVSAADTYTFRTFNDDGVFLLVDNTLIISDTGYHPEAPFQGSIALAPGNHTIELFFYENGGEASLEFSARNSTGTFGLVGANGGGLGGAVSQVTDSGIITFSDVDLTDAHLVSATPVGDTLGTLTATKNTDTTGTGTGGQLTWSYAVANSAIAYLAEGETKVESFTLTLNDQHGGVVTRQVDVTITGTNDAPVVVNDSYDTNEDAVLSIAAAGVLSNDSDVDQGTVLGVAAGTITTAMGATVVLNADGSFSYDARSAASLQALNDGQFADDSFNYTVTDGSGGSAVATVTIRVTGATDNRPPVAFGDSFTLTEDTALTQNVIANDVDPDAGDTLSVVNAGTFATTHGSVTLSANGQFTYTPAANYNGQDSFSYSVHDAAGAVSNTATVNLTVSPVNDAPFATNDGATTAEDTPVTINVVANDTDADGDALTVTGVSGLSHGAAQIVGNQIVYTPNANFSGTELFSYTVSDGHGGTDTAGVVVNVTPVNDAPVLNSSLRGGTILFVDDDRGLNGQSTWLTALAAKGYTVDYEAIAANGDPVRDLTGYGAVIWSNGDQAYTNLTAENVATLQAYLNSGGRLLYAGGHDLYDEPYVTAAGFAQNYLGVNNYNYNMPYISAGTPASGELGAVTLSPWAGGYYGGTMISGFNAIGGTSRMLLELGTGNDIAAINSTSTFRAATWSFDLNQLDAPYRNNVLDQTLKALGIGLSTNEDTALSLAGLTVSDVDAGMLSVVLSAGHGDLGVTAVAGLSGLTGNGGGNVTLTGSAAALNQALATLSYTPDANYNGADALNVGLSDLGNSGSGGALTASASYAITVRPVSDTHVLSNLITNGSFEQFSGGGTSAGSTAITGWTVTGSDVDRVASSGWQSGDGSYSLDLNGFHPGGVQQVLQTTPGVQYTVGFDLSKNPGNTDHATVLVSANNASLTSQSYTFSDANTGADMKWSQQVFSFTATGNSTTLSFASTYPTDATGGFPVNAQGPALDEVVVVSNKTIDSFTKGAGGDVLQLHDVLSSVNAPHDGTAFTGGYLRFAGSGSDTLVQLDANGGGNSYLTLATLSNTLLAQSDTANYVL